MKAADSPSSAQKPAWAAQALEKFRHLICLASAVGTSVAFLLLTRGAWGETLHASHLCSSSTIGRQQGPVHGSWDANQVAFLISNFPTDLGSHPLFLVQLFPQELACM